MRILYAAEAFGGGVYELVRNVAAGAARRGHEVMIAYGVRPETPADPRRFVCSTVELRETWRTRSASDQFIGAVDLRALARRWRPDVVHLYSTFAGLAGGLVIPKSTPTVFTPQAYAFTMSNRPRIARSVYRHVETFASRRATLLGACSQSEGKLAAQLAPRTRIAIVPNGIPELDVTHLPPRSMPEAPSVVAVGRTVPQRQPEACARILSSIAYVSETAWLGGAGGELGNPGANALRAAGIEVTGWQPREQMLVTLSQASAYLHWTAWDGLPLSVLEAMAADVPVVASDIGPNREVLGPAQVCRTEGEAICLLRRILDEPEFATRLLRSQRQRRSRYGADQMIASWLDLYGELIV